MAIDTAVLTGVTAPPTAGPGHGVSGKRRQEPSQTLSLWRICPTP